MEEVTVYFIFSVILTAVLFYIIGRHSGKKDILNEILVKKNLIVEIPGRGTTYTYTIISAKVGEIFNFRKNEGPIRVIG